jgi:UrcA family protein
MNTFNTPKSAIKTLLLSLITVGVFGGTAAIADQVGPSSLTKTVSLQDLNLSTVQGQQIARERVDKLARMLCDKVADPTDMSHHTNYLACVDATAAKAGASLQALINKQSTVQFARADVK